MSASIEMAPTQNESCVFEDYRSKAYFYKSTEPTTPQQERVKDKSVKAINSQATGWCFESNSTYF